jgi:hypothetical protein
MQDYNGEIGRRIISSTYKQTRIKTYYGYFNYYSFYSEYTGRIDEADKSNILIVPVIELPLD